MNVLLLAASLLSAEASTQLADALSGERALVHTKRLSELARYPGSKGFAAAAAYVAEEARRAGLQNVRLESFPMEGPRWDAVSAELWLEAPERVRLASSEAVDLALAQFSHAADVRAPLVDVGAGTSEADYAGRDVKGAVVLASGPPAAVQELAVDKKGAAGIVSYWHGEFYGVVPPRDAVSWGSLVWTKPGFAFMLSPIEGERLRQRVGQGPLSVHASIEVDAADAAEMQMVTGEIPGASVAGQDVLLSAHLDHQKPGANDNASGSAALVELARVLAARPPPRRTIRFWWTTEIASVYAYFERHPEEASRILANVNLDQEGGDIRRPTEFLFTQALRWLPSYWDDVLFSFAEDARERWAPALADPSPHFTAPTGSRFPLWLESWGDGDRTPGSDNYAFIDSLIGIPSNNIAAASLSLIHSSEDRPEFVDPTCLKRGMYLAGAPVVWLAEAGPVEARQALALVCARANAHLARDFEQAVRLASFEEARNVLRQGWQREVARIGSLRALAGGDAALAARVETEARSLESGRPGAEARLAAHFADTRVPSAGPDAQRLAKLFPQKSVAPGPDAQRYRRFRSDALPWLQGLYARNLADGRRSLLAIWDALRAIFPGTTLAAVESYFKALAEAGLVHVGGAVRVAG